MQQLINDPEFVRSAALLVIGAILTGLLVPSLKLILDNMNFRKQKLFEDQLARQNRVIKSQIDFLDHISELLWGFHALIARVSYYRKTSLENKEHYKHYTEALAEYETKLWDILIVQIQSEISKSRRLISSASHERLMTLYKDTLVGLDKELIQLINSDSSQEEWIQFHDGKLKGILVFEIDDVLHFLAEDMGLTVAGILWDLYDGGRGDDDNVDLTLDQIWEIVNQPNVSDLAEVYRNGENFFNQNGLNLQDLRDIFITHGACGEPYTDTNRDTFYTRGEPYEDTNNNGAWDENVNWGFTPDHGDVFTDSNDNGGYDFGEPISANEDGIQYNPPRPNRKNLLPFHGSNLCVNVVDSNGNPVNEARLFVTREDGISYSLPVFEVHSPVYFYVPTRPTEISVVAQKDGMRDSQPFRFNSTAYWRAVEIPETNCFLTHDFVLGSSVGASLIDIRRLYLDDITP